MSPFYRYRISFTVADSTCSQKRTISLKDLAALLGWGRQCGFHTHVFLLSILAVFKVLGV